MAKRTVKSTVIFTNPFRLDGFDEMQPAGSYLIETDEELLQGISFPVWRRVSTYMQLQSDPGSPGVVQTLTIDPDELAKALKLDAISRTGESAPDRATGAW